MINKTKNNSLSLKLIDFGLATYTNKNLANKKCGTAGYVAPEVLNADSYDSRVDLYSFGAIMYICLCGKPPFTGLNYQDLLDANRRGSVKFKSRYWNRVSVSAKNFTASLLDPNPNSRLTLENAILHDFIETNLKSEEKEDLINHTFKAETEKLRKVGSEKQISEIPTSTSNALLPTTKKTNLHLPEGSGSFYHHSGNLSPTSFIGQTPSCFSHSIASFYKNTEASQREGSSDKSLNDSGMTA
mmetsp:Transcript_15381/g.13121  ORF Transcript_15381/g.13121 Transcript_15381/m.13121 type:complete len:243 (+) Transcript_15381:93-821(+)